MTRQKLLAKSSSTESDVIAVIAKDNIRTLRPHIDGKSFAAAHAKPIILDPYDFARIKLESVLLPEEQKRSLEMELGKEKEIISQLAKNRRERMEEIDKQMANKQQPSDLDLENVEKNNSLLQKAMRQLEEEEDEIKRMNEFILHAKCMTIREAQIKEKKAIQEIEKQEQARMDAIMEAERLRDIESIHEREQERKRVMRDGAKIIRQQIDDRREAALLEAERKDREIKANLKTYAEQNEKEHQQKLKKVDQQKQLLVEIQKANAESIERRKNTKIQAREEDRRILQYILEKEKAEEMRDVVEKERKAEKEKELSRLRAMQQRLADKQAQQDALRAKRASEAYEREWRRKEKEAAEKKGAQEKALREERLKQQQDREHVIAVEALKMKQEFYEMIERQKQDESRVKQEVVQKSVKNRQYAKEVQDQIRHKEVLRKKERDSFFKEGTRFEKVRQEKKAHLEQVKERKLQEILSLGVPERYCHEIRRKMKELEKNKISNQPIIVKAAGAAAKATKA